MILERILSNKECRYFFDNHKMANPTLGTYLCNLNKFFNFVGEDPSEVSFKKYYKIYNLNGQLISTSPIDAEEIQAFINYLPKDKPNIKYRTASNLRTFFSVLCSKGAPLEGIKNPMQDFKIPKPQPSKKDILIASEFNSLVRSSKSLDHPQLIKAILYLLFGTGMRISELVNLPLVKTRDEIKSILVSPTKNKRQYLFPILPEIENNVLEYVNGKRLKAPHLPEAERFLLVAPTGEKLKKEWVNFILKKLCSEAGINKKITCHSFRRSFATMLWNNGASLMEIKELLNLKDISTARRYVHNYPNQDLRHSLDQNPLADVVHSFWQARKNRSLLSGNKEH